MWEKYAHSLKVWLGFLSAYGCRWDQADHRAQEAFKVWRVLGERNPQLVSLGTYDHDLIAIRLFYLWASAEYGVPNPIRMRRSRGRRRRDGSPTERAVTAPEATLDRDVKWFGPDGFARYRDVGSPRCWPGSLSSTRWRTSTECRSGAAHARHPTI